MMLVQQEMKEGTLTIKISGRVDTTTAPELEKQLKLDDVENLVFDLKETDYVSSAGLRVFLEALKMIDSNRGYMKIVHLQPMVKQVFCEVGFDKIIDLE